MRRIDVDDSLYMKLDRLDELGCLEDGALAPVGGGIQMEHALERLFARPCVFLEMAFLTEWSYQPPEGGHEPAFHDFMTEVLERVGNLLYRRAITTSSARVFAHCLLLVYLDNYAFAQDRDTLDKGLRLIASYIESHYPRFPFSGGFNHLYTYVMEGKLEGMSVEELNKVIKDCVNDIFCNDKVCADGYFWRIVNHMLRSCGCTMESRNDSLRDECFKFIAQDVENVFQYDVFQSVGQQSI